MSTIIPPATEPTNFPTGERRTVAVDTGIMSRLQQQRDNHFAAECLLSGSNLPAPQMVARPEGVYINVGNIDDLVAWVIERPGPVHVTAFEGVEMWTLHTATEPRSNGESVRVLVSATQPAGESVMHELRAAVVTS